MSYDLIKNLCYDSEKSRYFRCSVCNYGVSDLFEDSFKVYESGQSWNFCPNCGRLIVPLIIFDSFDS